MDIPIVHAELAEDQHLEPEQVQALVHHIRGTNLDLYTLTLDGEPRTDSNGDLFFDESKPCYAMVVTTPGLKLADVRDAYVAYLRNTEPTIMAQQQTAMLARIHAILTDTGTQIQGLEAEFAIDARSLQLSAREQVILRLLTGQDVAKTLANWLQAIL